MAGHVDRLLGAWRQSQRYVVAVSNEIGSGVVPETASGRRFRDALGQLNARVAAASDEVWLCTAGIARRGCDDARLRPPGPGGPAWPRSGPHSACSRSSRLRAASVISTGEAARAVLWLPVVGALLAVPSAGVLLARGGRW